jgi:hypothetical protein
MNQLRNVFPYLPVVSQTVKDVLQTLVDDNLVELDKIGISNCERNHDITLKVTHLLFVVYWSFPSARGSAVRSSSHVPTRN